MAAQSSSELRHARKTVGWVFVGADTSIYFQYQITALSSSSSVEVADDGKIDMEEEHRLNANGSLPDIQEPNDWFVAGRGFEICGVH